MPNTYFYVDYSDSTQCRAIIVLEHYEATNAALQDIYQPIAKLRPHQLAIPSQPLPQILRTNIPLLAPTTNSFVSDGQKTQHAAMRTNAATSTHAAYATTAPTMVPVDAKSGLDPRYVFTPINAHRANVLLSELNLRQKWNHVI